MARPDLSIIVCTYQRPRNLRLCLLAVSAQRDSPYKVELIVADDGSQDETPEVVERFRRETGMPVRFCTHPHEGFQPARTRNEGIAASTAPYILFLDGDCLIPPDHLATHFRLRRPGLALTTDAVRWDREASAACCEEEVLAGQFTRRLPRSERRRLRVAHWKALFYHGLRHPHKPRLLGGNFSAWRQDIEAINGFDENYRGWGCEDDDVGIRLHQLGVRVVSIRQHTFTFHLWHPPSDLVPRKIREGGNFAYFQRRGRLTQCRKGLRKRGLGDLRCVLRGGQPGDPWTRKLAEMGLAAAVLPPLQSLLDKPDPAPGPACWMAGPCEAGPLRDSGVTAGSAGPWHRADQPHRDSVTLEAPAASLPGPTRPEVEITVWPQVTAFAGPADCRVLLITQPGSPGRRLLRRADIVLGPWKTLPPGLPLAHNAGYFPITQLESALAAIQ